MKQSVCERKLIRLKTFFFFFFIKEQGWNVGER